LLLRKGDKGSCRFSRQILALEISLHNSLSWLILIAFNIWVPNAHWRVCLERTCDYRFVVFVYVLTSSLE